MSDVTRQRLIDRDDIDNGDIDDIIGIAAELHQAEQEAGDGATAAEVEAVAEELDIPARFVEQAIQILEQRREQEADRARKDELQRAERRRIRRVVVASALGFIAALVVAGATVVLDTADDLKVAATNLEQHARYVEVVLDRQAGLVPQLVALSGGEPGELVPLAATLNERGPLEERLQASRALDLACGSVLAELEPPRDDNDAIQRLGLGHELTGVQNRRSTEMMRLEEARGAWARARTQWGAGPALLLGLAREPDI
ncbi:MAG: hypothetical protein ABIO70_33290 [Pseudomonadota bacterium]